MTRRPITVLWLASFSSLALGLAALRGAQPQAEPRRWSANLLNEVVREPQRSAAHPAAGERRKGEGVVLRSYQLRTVRVGEAGRSRSLLQTMEHLLPAGSSMETDVPANTLHLLTTPEAHAAVWDFISAVDQAPASAANAEKGVELRGALERLASSAKRSDELAAAVAGLRDELARSRPNSGGATAADWRIRGGVTAALLVLVGFVLVRSRFRRSGGAGDPPASAAIVPADQIALALAPAQQRLQQEMMGVLNAAAIRMESWYGEQAAQRDQLAEAIAGAGARVVAENEALLQRAEARFEHSASRIEANVRQLAVQNDRVEALAGELQTTVRELDSTKDQMLRLQSDLDLKGRALDATREELTQREHELTRQQAKLAALTLILEEGGVSSATQGASAQAEPNEEISPCTTPQPRPHDPPRSPAAAIPYTFRFLPPDHPEN